MSVVNNSRSLLKSIDALNCETSKSSIIIKNITLNTNNTKNVNKIYETAVDQPTDAKDYYSFSSDTNEMYYSDSEGSKLLILPQHDTFVHNMPSVLHLPSSSDSDIDYCKVMSNKPLATSSPLSKLQNSIKNKYYRKKTSKRVSIDLKMSNDDIKSKSKASQVKKCHKNSGKTISSYKACLSEIPNLSNKTASPKYNNLQLIENQEKTDKHTKHSTFNRIKQVSQKSLNDVTNILHTNQSQITLQKSSFTTNTTLNKKSENSAFQLNLLFDKTENSNPNKSNKIGLVYNSLKSEKSSTKNQIEENQTLNTKIIYNNSQIIYNIIKNTTFDENYLNNTDLSDIFQMELSLKMFSGNIVPYMNSMKHEILQIMNKCMYKHDQQITKRSKHVNDIIKNIYNIMKANVYNCIDSSSNKNDYSTIPFVGVDLNNLNVLNNKMECVKKKLEQVKLCENILNDEEDKSVNQHVQNDFLEFNSLDDLKSFKPATDNTNAVISSTKTAELDSFSCMRELNKSNSLLHPISDCMDINEPSQKPILENCSLTCINDLPTNEISKTMAQDLSFLSYNEPLLDKLAPINDNLASQFEDVICNDNLMGKNQSRYWLRKNPKSTDHYFSPYLKTSFKTPKQSCIKSKYNDMFICTGTGNKKVIHQYKLKSVLKANSDELIKIISPEIKNKKFSNDNQNTTVFDITKLKPKKIEKPCRCGIFPSQVPSSWNDSLHTSLHKNLHKLQFKSQLPVNIASKINVNGFLFNIIKVTDNCDNLNLRLTLKNIQDFIHLEIDFSKKSINNNLNHTIFLAVDPKFKIIGYLEIEPLTNACIYQNSQLSKNLVAVKFGISKLWVMVKYRNNGVATKLLKLFCDEENVQTNYIAFAFHGNHGIAFIKKQCK